MRKRKNRAGDKRWFFGCEKCDKVLPRHKGQWVSLRPTKEVRGYFVPQTICPVISAKDMVDEYKDSKKQPNGMKIFYNFNLGKAYETGEYHL